VKKLDFYDEGDEYRELFGAIDSDGFEYAVFKSFDWKSIKNKRFHALRREAKKSMAALRRHIENKMDRYEEKIPF